MGTETLAAAERPSERTAAEPPAGIGHNRPPLTEVVKEHRARSESLIAAVNAWKTGVPVIETEEQASKAQDLIDQLRAEWAKLDGVRTEERRPHLEAAQAVQDAFKPLLDAVEICGRLMKPLRDKWLLLVEERQRKRAAEAAEAARLAAEKADMARGAAEAGLRKPVESQLALVEAEKKAAEAEIAARQAEKAAPRVAGSLGGRAVGFTTTWSATIDDIEKVLLHYKDHAKIREALQKLLDADARAFHERFAVPGATLVKGRR